MVFGLKRCVHKARKVWKEERLIRSCSKGASKSPREKSIVKVTSCILKRTAALELSPTDCAAYS